MYHTRRIMAVETHASNNIYANSGGQDVENNVTTAEREGLLIPTQDDNGYQVREEPYGTKRPVRVILMGAGASTLNFLKKSSRAATERGDRRVRKES